jgi:hypothetical protein
MIELTPKKRFLENDEATRYFRSIADNGNFHYAVMVSLSELSLRQTTTAEQLAGARNFISILLNIAEVEPPRSDLPQKKLVLHPDTRKPPETSKT